MLSLRSIIAVLLLVVIGVVVYRLPARWISDRIDAPGVEIDGVAGSVWRGQITRLAVNGEPVAPLAWRLDPLALLSGRIEAAVEVYPRGGAITGTLVATRNQALEARDLKINGALQHIAGGTSLGPILGDIDAQFDKLAVAPAGLTAAIGFVAIDNLRYPVNAPYALGGFQLDCNDESGPPVECALRDQGDGPLEVNANLALGPARAYQLDGQVRARPNAPPELRQGLVFLGPADANGFHELQFEGSLD
ncbi:MAG: type II secretion system protein N [Pseudomonadota bacterium]